MKEASEEEDIDAKKGKGKGKGEVFCYGMMKTIINCSDALTLCQYDPPVKSYDQIKFWCDVPIVITM